MTVNNTESLTARLSALEQEISETASVWLGNARNAADVHCGTAFQAFADRLALLLVEIRQEQERTRDGYVAGSCVVGPVSGRDCLTGAPLGEVAKALGAGARLRETVDAYLDALGNSPKASWVVADTRLAADRLVTAACTWVREVPVPQPQDDIVAGADYRNLERKWREALETAALHARERDEWMRKAKAVPAVSAEAFGLAPEMQPVVDELRRRMATATSPDTFMCKARNATDPPQDCNWPMCGCDPYADKVIAALEESMVAVRPVAPPPQAACENAIDGQHAWSDASYRFNGAVTCAHCGARGLKAGAVAPSPTGWEPIETAPKDGTAFRAYSPALIDADFNPWGSVEAVYDGDHIIGAVWNGQSDIWNSVFIEPTHWMPLPAPPAARPEGSR